MHKSRVKRLKHKAKIKPASSNFRWSRYLLGTLFAGIVTYGVVRTINKNELITDVVHKTVVTSPDDSKPFSQLQHLTIPPAKISLTTKKSDKQKLSFQSVDALVESTLKKTEIPECPYYIGPKDHVPEFMHSLQRKLKEHGFNLASSSDPPKFFESLFSFYMENNVWIVIRTATKRHALITEKVACLFKFPIIQRASFSYSYFDNRLSAKDIPVYYLADEGMPEQNALVGGVTTARGLMIFSGKIDPDNIFDRTIHEGVHHSSIKIEGEILPTEYDFDANAEESEIESVTINRGRDELRAYMIQIMYGRKPFDAADTLLNSVIFQNVYGTNAFLIAIEDFLREDPSRLALYRSSRLKITDFSEAEIRELAYFTFLKYDLLKHQ